MAAWLRRRLRHRSPSPAPPPPATPSPPPPAEAPVRAEAPARVSRATVEGLVGQPVGALALYELALTHRSLLRGVPNSHLASNERLEFLGDAVLGFVTAEHLYTLFPGEDEGFLTRLRAKVVNGPALAASAQRLGLGAHVLISDNMEQGGGRTNETILADALEALIGALYLDQGLVAARTFIHRAMLDTLDLRALSAQHDNYKSALLEHAQGLGWPQPEYRLVAEEGPSHDKTFTVEAWVNGRALGSGTAASKKKAEQQAAQEALHRLLAEPS